MIRVAEGISLVQFEFELDLLVVCEFWETLEDVIFVTDIVIVII